MLELRYRKISSVQFTLGMLVTVTVVLTSSRSGDMVPVGKKALCSAYGTSELATKADSRALKKYEHTSAFGCPQVPRVGAAELTCMTEIQVHTTMRTQ